MEPKLSFHNGKFKVMQIADAQEFSFVSRDTVLLLTMAVLLEKPDLVIFTGDQIHGMDPTFRLGNVRDNVEKTLYKLTKPIVKAGIPFAVTYGNHDAQVGLTNVEQAEIYATFAGCLRGVRRSEEDPGTFYLPVFGGDGNEKLRIFALDTGLQDAEGAYLPLTKARLAFIKENSPSGVKTAVFQHIPVPEFYDVLEEVQKGTPGAVEAYRTREGKYYRLPAEIVEAGGYLGESPAVPDENGGEFDALRENGNVLFIAVGHDHNNAFVAEKDGIRLIYTPGAGFHAYGPGENRGVRVFEFDEDDPAAFTTRLVTYRDAVGGEVSNPVLDFALTHIPTSVEEVRKIPVVGDAVVNLVNAIGEKLNTGETKSAPEADEETPDFTYETLE